MIWDHPTAKQHPTGEYCPPVCEACADREAEARDADAYYAIYAERRRRADEWSEWQRLFGELEAVRRALTGALPLLANEQYWSSREDTEGDDLFGERFPQAEWAVRFWLLDAAPSDRDAMERLTRALYRSQIAVLARYADLTRLTPDLRARVEAAVAAPEMTPS
jgi:hypothetical protein